MYGALLSVYRALLSVYRALLSVYRALLSVYRDLRDRTASGEHQDMWGIRARKKYVRK